MPLETEMDTRNTKTADLAGGRWAGRMDRICVVAASLVPVGFVTGNAGFESMIALTGLGWLIGCGVRRENPLPAFVSHPVAVAWMAWFGVVVLSLLINGAGSKGWGHDIAIVRHLIFFTALIDISRRRPVAKAMLIGMAAGIAWGAVNTLLAHLVGHDVLGRDAFRYTQKLKDAERIASFSAYAALFFITWGILDRQLAIPKRLLALAAGAVGVLLMVTLGIRTGMVGVVGGAGFIVLYELKRFLSRTVLAAMLLLAVAAGGLFLTYGYSPQDKFLSMYDRFNIWKVAWTLWEEHPLVGVSVSNWQDAYAEKEASGTVEPIRTSDGVVIRSPDATHPHNLFFQLISCTGILGLGCFVWLFVSTTRLIFRQPVSWRLGMVTWPMAFLVIGITGWNIYGSQYQTLFAYFVTLAGLQSFPD